MAEDNHSEAARPPSARDLLTLLACVAPLAALPWLVERWPTQGGPNHLALAYAVQHFDDPGEAFSQYFHLALRFGPHCGYYYALLALGRLMSLAAAERVLTSAIIAGMPAAVLLLLLRVAPARWRNVYVVVPMATGWLLMKGFTSFVLSFVLGLVALAIAWGRPGGRLPEERRPAGAKAIAGGAAVLLASMLAHPFVPVLVGFALVVLEAPRLRRLRTWLELAAVGAPAALVLGVSEIQSRGGAPPGPAVEALVTYEPIYKRLGYFFLANLTSLSAVELLFRGLPAVLLLAAGVRAAARVGVRGGGRDQDIARLLVASAALFFALPFSMAGWVHPPARVSPFVILVAALIAGPFDVLGRARWGWALALAPSLGLAIVQQRAAARSSAEVAEVVEAGKGLARGSVLLPLSFHGEGASVGTKPIRNAWGHLVLERGVITPYFFAGGRDRLGGAELRPLVFSKPLGPGFLPALNENTAENALDAPEGERQAAYQAILDAARTCDALLVHAPPDDFLELARAQMTVERNVGSAWLMRPAVRP